MAQFTPLSSGFGAETADVDLRKPLADAAWRELEQAFYDHQVLAIRAQDVTPAQFVAFARRIGPPQPHVIDQFHHPEDPNILILSNVKNDGKPTGLQDAGSYFHTDYSYLAVPARATTLYSRVVPKAGGDTLFANQQAAYDDLPEAMKKRIAPLYGIHHYGNRNDQDEKSRTVASVLTDEQKAKMPLITHKIARPHPVTGRTSLYAVSGSSFGIVGMPEDEARDLLDELAAHSTQAEVPAALQVRRRRHRGLGQRVAPAFGDAHRSRRRAHALAHHVARDLAGSSGARRARRRRSRERLEGCDRRSRGRHDLHERRAVAFELPGTDAGNAGELRQVARPLRCNFGKRAVVEDHECRDCLRSRLVEPPGLEPLQQRVVGSDSAERVGRPSGGRTRVLRSCAAPSCASPPAARPSAPAARPR